LSLPFLLTPSSLRYPLAASGTYFLALYLPSDLSIIVENLPLSVFPPVQLFEAFSRHTSPFLTSPQLFIFPTTTFTLTVSSLLLRSSSYVLPPAPVLLYPSFGFGCFILCLPTAFCILGRLTSFRSESTVAFTHPMSPALPSVRRERPIPFLTVFAFLIFPRPPFSHEASRSRPMTPVPSKSSFETPLVFSLRNGVVYLDSYLRVPLSLFSVFPAFFCSRSPKQI